MTATLHVVFDLGSDSLKTVYGYRHPDGSCKYGSLDTKDDLKVGIPAVALFKRSEKKWLFGYEVTESGETNFTTLVQIKDLIWLLESEAASDKTYYSKKQLFPEYDLPGERKKFKSMDDIAESGKLFDGGITPKELCLQFFKYAKKHIDKEVKALRKLHSSAYSVELSEDYICSMIFPTGKTAFAKELERILSSVFGKLRRSMNSVKAFGLYAHESVLVDDNEKFLIFDIGEKQISVAKAWNSKGQPCVEGVEGHNPPEEIGGINIDEAIRRGIEDALLKRETLATPSYGKPGHVGEVCIDSKKYQLLQDIKSAKHMLCSPGAQEYYPNGVPLYISYECLVRYTLTARKMEQYVCTASDGALSAFKRIAQYVVSEAKRGINRDVSKIFLAGGVANTKGLCDFIATELLINGCTVRPTALDTASVRSRSSTFAITGDERSIYACALGTAIAAVKGIDIRTMLSLSYGTWGAYDHGLFLNIFAEKGKPLYASKPTVFASPFNYGFGDETGEYSLIAIKDDTIISTHASSEMLESDARSRARSGSFYFKNNSTPRLILARSASELKSMLTRGTGSDAMSYYGLRAEFFSDIIFLYQGQPVLLRTERGKAPKIRFQEGIKVSPDGAAEIYFENVTEEFQTVRVVPYVKYDPSIVHYSDADLRRMGFPAPKLVKLRDIELRPLEAKNFKVKSN